MRDLISLITAIIDAVLHDNLETRTLLMLPYLLMLAFHLAQMGDP